VVWCGLCVWGLL